MILSALSRMSSSTSTSIIITMVGARILTVSQAIYMVMGCNVGTSITRDEGVRLRSNLNRAWFSTNRMSWRFRHLSAALSLLSVTQPSATSLDERSPALLCFRCTIYLQEGAYERIKMGVAKTCRNCAFRIYAESEDSLSLLRIKYSK